MLGFAASFAISVTSCADFEGKVVKTSVVFNKLGATIPMSVGLRETWGGEVGQEGAPSLDTWMPRTQQSLQDGLASGGGGLRMDVSRLRWLSR